MSKRQADLAEAVVAGDRRALARAITLVESGRPDDCAAAAALLQRLPAAPMPTLRIGISGIPGVGKSTFIEALGLHALEQGCRVAVLTIDPTSQRSGGSILADKTRMPELSQHPHAFVRPSPAGQMLGGVARRTREAILLCEAGGFDLTLVETVGVGQSETAAAELTDMFLLMLMPAAGDQLQGIKRGIMELADLVVVNKADGPLLEPAARATRDCQLALSLISPRSKLWTPRVLSCSALNGDGLAAVWRAVGEYRAAMTAGGELPARRTAQAKAWLWAETQQHLLDEFRTHPRVSAMLTELEAEVIAGRLPAPLAAQRLVELFQAGATPKEQ